MNSGSSPLDSYCSTQDLKDTIFYGAYFMLLSVICLVCLVEHDLVQLLILSTRPLKCSRGFRALLSRIGIPYNFFKIVNSQIMKCLYSKSKG
jgi:hypothetical protein